MAACYRVAAKVTAEAYGVLVSPGLLWEAVGSEFLRVDKLDEKNPTLQGVWDIFEHRLLSRPMKQKLNGQ